MYVPKYMAIHKLPETMKSEAVELLTRNVAANSTLDAYWVGTLVQLDDEGQVLRFICEWNAKDVKSVEDVFTKFQSFHTTVSNR